MSFRIIAVVVTYNRLPLLKKSIEALRSQSKKLDSIIVVNNGSTDGTYEWLNEQTDLLIFHQENTGGSGGFYRGIKEAYERDFDWIWVMDDDAFADNKAVQELNTAIENHGQDQDYCFYSNNDEDVNFIGIEKNIKEAMFVGFAVTKKIIKNIGLPRNDFFIYFDDAEYCERIIKNNYKILKLKNSIINHRSFIENEFHEMRILNFKISFHKMSDFKLFYYLRNRLLMYDTLSIKWFKVVVYYMFLYPKIFILTNQRKIAAKAIFNGLIRKSGTYKF